MLKSKPAVDAARAVRILEEEFAFAATSVSPLDSYEDVNWLAVGSFADASQSERSGLGTLDAAARDTDEDAAPLQSVKVVLKVHNAVDSLAGPGLAQLQAQEAALAAAHRCLAPKQPRGAGRFIQLGSSDLGSSELNEAPGAAAGPSSRHYVRLLSYVDGDVLCSVEDPSPALLERFGSALALLDRDLAGLNHPGSERHLIWDLRHALDTIEGSRSAVADAGHAALVDQVVAIFRSEVLPLAASFRLATIHGDANDHNVVVNVNADVNFAVTANANPNLQLQGNFSNSNSSSKNGDSADSGEAQETGIALIDFGDLVRTWLPAEVAIAMAYTLVAEPRADRKLGKARAVLRGYVREFPLLEAEAAALFGLVAARLAVSACVGAKASLDDPGNAEYTLVHASGAWDTLRFLLGLRADALADAAAAGAGADAVDTGRPLSLLLFTDSTAPAHQKQQQQQQQQRQQHGEPGTEAQTQTEAEAEARSLA